MSELNQTNTKIYGAGFAELQIPIWIKFVRFIFSSCIFAALCLICFHALGWTALFSSTTVQLVFSLFILSSLILSISILKTKVVQNLFCLRKNSQNNIVYSGFSNHKQRLRIAVSLLIAASIPLYLAALFFHNFPLLQTTEIRKENVSSLENQTNLLPIYFWDYATWVNPSTLSDIDLLLPYEKGLPQKLLSKVYFQNLKTKNIDLALHGKRPRMYPKDLVHELFSELQNKKTYTYPRFWPLLFRLQLEAGISSDKASISRSKPFQLIQFIHSPTLVTEAIGLSFSIKSENTTDQAEPTRSAASSTASSDEGKLFFWSPEGNVFQVQCPYPCQMKSMLEQVVFPEDPQGSLLMRKEWTMATLQKLLKESVPQVNLAAEQRKEWILQHQKILTLYLISLLTLDPRDPEAFFHLGKLAQNKETIRSSILYGKDLGLEPEKIAELETRLAAQD